MPALCITDDIYITYGDSPGSFEGNFVIGSKVIDMCINTEDGCKWIKENRDKINASIKDPIINIRPSKSPKIGMTSSEVRQSTWGSPDEINKTTYAWGTTEQWCYSDYKYIYFKNGVVTAISE